MIKFQLYKSGLYLTETDINDPSKARIGFMFQSASGNPTTFELSQQTWIDPNQQGYFAFFVPSATRDWDSFSASVRNLFSGTFGAQFGWFSESGGNVTAETLFLVGNQGTSTPRIQSPASFIFNNVTLQIQPNPFGQPAVISFNDDTNTFEIVNPSVSGQPAVRIVAQPPVGASQTYFSNSPSLLLPMVDPHAGSVNAGFQFDTQALAQFEAGFMYFGPPPQAGQPLTALNYPLLRAPGGAPTALNFQAWLDVLQPLVGTRSYFQITDTQTGSYYASTSGRAFALLTTADGDSDQTSRLVFANRPFQTTDDAQFYYLTPAGRFQLAMDQNGAQSVSSSAPPSWLMCGVTGTEFLNAKVSGEVAIPDALYFLPGQAAYRVIPPPDQPAGNDPQLLDDVGGNVTTSWVQYLTSEGGYISQPEGSPLYEQGTNGSGQLSEQSASSGLTVYVLDFLPLPSWSPTTTGVAAVQAQTAAPAVPMTPYAGIPFTTDLTPFREMESRALNPTRKNAFTNAQPPAQPKTADAAAGNLTFAMTPQGLLAGLTSAPAVWTTTQIALSKSGILQLTDMGNAVRQALQQNQIFIVISTTENGTLFSFNGSDQTLDIADWLFSLSPDGIKASDGTPPILILKFYPGQSISTLVKDMQLWSQPDTFNVAPFDASKAQAYVQQQIQQACEAVYGAGKCTDGIPSGGTPDTNSLYYNFYRVVTDPLFNGILALNCNMQLNALPAAIRAVLGGMTDASGASNLDAFRVHHVGVEINDTDPKVSTPTLAQSSLFGLVDYEKPTDGGAPPLGLDVKYNFEVEFLRALFTNSELREFSCKINLTINNLFDTAVSLDAGSSSALVAEAESSNVVVITGSYQAHSTTGDDANSGQGIYSFLAEGNFAFNFDEANPYLKSITLTKLQFSFQEENPTGNPNTSTLKSRFSIWGNMVFKELNVLDIFSFEKLVFADLGITVSFDLTIDPPNQPSTANLKLGFSPGDLRFDFAQTTDRQSPTSLLSLIPFKLKSFLYSQNADQTLQSLQYYAVSEVPGLSSVKDTFNYALIFDLDLGSVGSLVGSLAAFKFSILIGWLSGDEGGIAFGVQLPEADGKLEIKIEGVLTLSIEEFKLQYKPIEDGSGKTIFVLALHNSYLELFGTRLPPGNAFFDFALFAPSDDAARIGWIAAINNQSKESGGSESLALRSDGQALAENGNGSPVFELVYLGGGQRVGPDPSKPPTNFQDFLSFMTGDFWDAVKANKYDEVYHPDSNWLVVSDFKLLGIIEVGFVFYDFTPFYSLTLNVTKLFNFEITYTKISDSIGLFYADLALPDTLRTFQVGAASLTLPSISVSVYTNGNWKLDVGFPKGDDWSRSFRVQAQAGPVPVTGSGGFYIASLSSATSSIFKGNYPSIVAFGFAARLGVGKDFTSGPLKAGISVTFFGIIQGAGGYLASGSVDIFQTPDALSLQGQFGIIGELYGSIDFKIIKASVNVTLQASIGIQLLWERSIPGSGTILLYVEASVKLSIKVSIGFGFFSISISFSFKASFRFEWVLAGSPPSVALRAQWSERLATGFVLTAAPLALCPGLNSKVPLWFLPELTVIFPNTTGTGAPWFVCSLGIPYDSNPPADPTYAQFMPFEAVTTQLVTWALSNTSEHTGCSSVVTQEQLQGLDEAPEILVGWVDYPSLITELSNFAVEIVVPTGEPGTEKSATTFPMLPFLKLETKGRLEGGQSADLSYQFLSKNLVSDSYIQEVEEYFNQLFVNQTQGEPPTLKAATEATTPLIQEIFLDYFTGLIRGGVHQLLQYMQDEKITESPLDELIRKAVGAGLVMSLAGQMSSSFRGGVRLPYTPGLTVPGGAALTTTNPLYALLWQEFPAGQLSPVEGDTTTSQYTIELTNPDATQTWVKSSVNWPLTNEELAPYQNLKASDVIPPSVPVQLPFTNTGPQSFSFENPVVWTQPDNKTVSLRPFPSNLQQLQSVEAGAISVLVESRETGAPYLPGGTLLSPQSFNWVTMITLTVKQIPATSGKDSLPDIFALSGASQQDQALIEQILRELEGGEDPIVSLQVLYQTEAGATGLTSVTINPQDVFALRTNTTTVSAPPASANLLFKALAVTPGVAVGATIDDHYGFLQIIQQAAVTNAPGYNLRYEDATGNGLPTDLFNAGPAPLTLLVAYKPDGSQNTEASPAQVLPFYNGIVLTAAVDGLLYYADTTDPALETQYNAVAAGSVGAELTRSDSVMKLRTPQTLAATAGLKSEGGHTRAELVSAICAAGVTDHAQLRSLMVEAGAAPAQLNALYSLITYQVEASAGFIQSNLSAPIQPQQPDPDTESELRDYRVFVPLYNLATANQSLPPDTPPNRYASIDASFSVDFFQNDAFGNQMPTSLGFGGTNLYFDPITPVDEWLGVVTAYDFLVDTKPQPNTFSVYLYPSASAFSGDEFTSDQAAAALQLYQTAYDQITGPGVSFYVEANFALQSDGTMVKVELSQSQSAAIVDMVGKLVEYLEKFDTNPPFDVPPVTLTVSVTGTGTLPPVFEMAVLLGIERDPDLVSPLLKNEFGQITFPSAQNVSSTISSTVGASLDGQSSVDINTFAANFVQAFPALSLSVGLNGATSPQQQSSAGLARKQLKALGLPGDGTGASQKGPQSLWAVQHSLLDITIGAGAGSGPRYMSPKPLDNTLNTAVVPLPQLDSSLPQLPTEQLFTDVDLDQFNRSFFQSVDNILAPASAAKAFEVATDAYNTITLGRKTLAEEYSQYEVEWLFSVNSPFTGTSDQLTAAREDFQQQMRAALLTAYSVDTLVQYSVSWNSSVPPAADDRISLFGQVQPPSGPLKGNDGLSTAHVAVSSTGPGLLTFLYGTSAVRDIAQVSLDLVYNVTHVEYFLEPANQTPPGEARPSIWLQLVNPYPDGLPHIGPADKETIIPLVFRQYPTPPVFINQSGAEGTSSEPTNQTSENPLTAAAAWHYIYSYQSQLTAHDLIISLITYNTNLTAASSGGNQLKTANAAAGPFTLFQALARFTAAYALLQPILKNLDDPAWAKAAEAFASLVTEVTENIDWNPVNQFALKASLANITDSYTITDVPQNNQQLITLEWTPEQGESSWPGATLSILALAPNGQPYPNQIQGKVPNGITDLYTPIPPLVDQWVIHQVEVDSLNVLMAENALMGVQIERNLIQLEDGQGTTWEALTEFVYKTPMVRPSQPVTPFVTYDGAIDVAQLPNQGISTGCPSSESSLCQRVYTMMYDLLADPDQITGLLEAKVGAGLEESAARRVKVGCGFQYPVSAVSGGQVGNNPITPLVPVVLARSFDLDAAQEDQLNEFADLYSQAISHWSDISGVSFGPSSEPAQARLVFDITLYAQLSGLNTPVLRLSNLQLKLTDIDPV